MKMSNSKLVTYKKISPNKTSPREAAIDTITIHCMAGPLSVETCGDLFAKKATQASSNYGIGPDGRIALYVDEKDRSWCSSSRANDKRAVTIEVASDSKPPYKVTKEAYNALIKLVADICKRNKIKKLLWKGDKSLIGQVDKQNMTVHRWFANKACPGEYLYKKHPDIVKKVNKLLKSGDSSVPTYVVGHDYYLQAELKVRTGPGTNYKAKKHSQLTNQGKQNDKDRDGALDKGTRIICYEIKQNGKDIWIRCPSGWLAAYYKGKVYIK